MRSIEVTDSIKTKRTIQIEHPIFRCYGDTLDSGRDYEIFERWDADGTEWEITETTYRNEISYEIKKSRRTTGEGESEEFLVGGGRYRLAPEAFAAVLERARKFLSEV